MVWLLRKLIKIIIILAILGIIAALVMVLFLNPNDFRSQINTALQEYTGQRLQVKGPIQWTLRPKAKLQLQDVVLNKASDETIALLRIKQAFVSFDGLSYFTKNLVITNLELNDVAIDGDLVQALSNENPKRASTIKSLVIKNVSILNPKPDEKLNWQLKNSVLSANNLVISPTAEMNPIKLQGDVVNVNTDATFNIDAVLKVDQQKHTVTLDPLTIIWNNIPVTGNSIIARYENDTQINGTLALDNTAIDNLLKKLDPYYESDKESKIIQGQVNYAYQINSKLLDLTNMRIQLNSGTIDGNIKASLASPHQVEFTLTADNFDLLPISLFSKAFFPTTQASGLIPVDLVENLTINGKFTGNNLHVNHKLQMEQLSFTVVGQGGVLQFNPVAISAYGATHNITLNVDVINKAQPFFQITEQAENVAMEPWLGLIEQHDIISGNANIKASMEAMGNDVTMLKQTLTGSMNMYVNDGILHDLDTTALMGFTAKAVNEIFNQMNKAPNTDLRALAISKSSDWINSQQNNPQTKFDQFELKADIQQGISKKASIAMDNSDVELKATGGFNLIDNTVDFTGTLVSKQEVASEAKFLAGYMKQTALPIIITGTIQKPIFGPNIQEYAVNIISLAKKDILSQAISKMVAVTPPNIKTSKTASDLFLDSLQSLSK